MKSMWQGMIERWMGRGRVSGGVSNRGLRWLAILFSCTVSPTLMAWDGPADNHPNQVRPIPPPGIAIPEATRTQLLQRTAAIRQSVAQQPGDEDDAAQVLVFARAIEMTLETGMVYSEQELAQLDQVLEEGERRAVRWSQGDRGWKLLGLDTPDQARPTLLVGGFVSKIDQSIQPFGLVIPAGWKPEDRRPRRMDVWLHGRDERTSEAGFLHRRMTQPGEFTPENTLVLHPYGRYSNAFKFAGEVDVYEAIEATSRRFAVDSDRVSIRGFSMGGAGCWQLAVHDPSRWFAATPGAGFSETRKFLKEFQGEDFQPVGDHEKLLHWYDCPDWVENLRHLPLVAYSGAKDRQKQAADVMAEAMASRGMQLDHRIGPDTEHKYHPESKKEIEERMTQWAQQGRPILPREVEFVTYTLKYPSSHWVHIDRLGKHWERAWVRGQLTEGGKIDLQTTNIDQLTLRWNDQAWGKWNEGGAFDRLQLQVDGQSLQEPAQPQADGFFITLHRQPQTGLWQMGPRAVSSRAKRPGLQGPIDDAFMSRFVMVGPQTPDYPLPVDQWSTKEFEHAKAQWRRHFRGDVPLRTAESLSASDLQQSHLVLFGTPQTNPWIARIVDQLPILWRPDRLNMLGVDYDAATHAPILIYPNPLNPDRYVVINSGFTFREYAYLNNARQIPMLPDWAIVDLREKVSDPSSGNPWSDNQWPGKLVDRGFFGELWEAKR